MYTVRQAGGAGQRVAYRDLTLQSQTCVALSVSTRYAGAELGGGARSRMGILGIRCEILLCSLPRLSRAIVIDSTYALAFGNA